ncbi:alpha/beta hydrolase [Catellatospora citrea]|uniref:alpha/beta fold hydrolase n=1 Tax=Catellatospora citrea TaxID=53366 RepID=UPI003408BF8E
MPGASGGARRERGTIRSAGARTLCWQVDGAADDPTLLWLHGSTGSSRTAPTLPGVRVVSYDRPGYGGSTLHPQRTLMTDADDVEALLDHLGIDRTAVLAFSGGAAIAYAAGVSTPQRVTRLGIVSGAPWPTAPAPSAEVLLSAATALSADPGAAVDRLAVNASLRDAEVLNTPALRHELLEGATDAVSSGVAGWLQEAHLLRTRWPFEPRDVRVPVLMWHGSEDQAVSFDAASTVAGQLPQAYLQKIENAGHLGWMLERAEIAAQLISS